MEDTPANLKFVTMLLSNAGHRVFQARTAEDGITLAIEHRPQLILMDINLPGMDGIEAMRVLRRRAHARDSGRCAHGTRDAGRRAHSRSGAATATRPSLFDTKVSWRKSHASWRHYEGEIEPKTQATVVAVDDKGANLRLLRAYLQTEPYRVLTFTDPKAALDAIEDDPPESLVLLDLMMPVIDGFAMLEMLKDVAPGVPVVIVTAMDDREARLKGLAAGARDFLGKPVDRSELLIRVRNLVALKQSTDSLEAALSQLSAANRDLQAFAGSLAHDLQQPLTTIAAFAQVMERHSAHYPLADASHLKRIAQAAETARSMVKALLEFARLGQAQLVKLPVDLNRVVEDARNTVAAAADARNVRWNVGALPTLHGDSSLLLLASSTCCRTPSSIPSTGRA